MRQSNQLTKSSTVIKQQQPEDYYSDDADDGLSEEVKDIRTIENWICLGVLAISIIGSLILLIVIINLRSRKESNLMYL